MSEEFADAEVDFLLERFDQTDPSLQRRIVAAFVAECVSLRVIRCDLLLACRKAVSAYDSAHETGKSYWAGADVDEMRAAIAKAEGSS